MNTGAAAAHAEILLFVHADTRLPRAALERVRHAIDQGQVWGHFKVRLSGRRFAFRVIETLMNWRSRISRTATGDQAMFVRRDVFKMLGGFADIALMEDIELCGRLNWIGPPACLSERAVTSSRRWERRGIVRTVLLMWLLRLMYRLGVPPSRLARWYT
jgi:rSAM/selenodomain-associated transferase 2